MADDDTPPRRIGRPPGTTRGVTTIRHVRVGQLWDDCATQAKADNQTMTAFVHDAITHELNRRRKLTSTPAADVPHVHAPSGGVAVFHADGTADAVGNVDTLRAVSRELDRRAATARVCSCDDDDCGGTCAGSVRLVDGNHWDIACDDRPDCTIRAHHSDDDAEAFACDTCGLEFDTRTALDGHEAESPHA